MFGENPLSANLSTTKSKRSNPELRGNELATNLHFEYLSAVTSEVNSPCFFQETFALKKSLPTQFTAHFAWLLGMHLVLPTETLYQRFRLYDRLDRRFYYWWWDSIKQGSLNGCQWITLYLETVIQYQCWHTIRLGFSNIFAGPINSNLAVSMYH